MDVYDEERRRDTEQDMQDEFIPLYTCDDCMNDFFAGQGRFSHLESGVWLCDDCFDQREEE